MPEQDYPVRGDELDVAEEHDWDVDPKEVGVLLAKLQELP